MITVLSPAKTLDFETDPITASASQPLLIDRSEYLVSKLKKFSAKKLAKMYKVNPEIAELNYQRFQQWSTPFHSGNAKQAILSFTGEVYRGLNADVFTEPDFEFAQKHVRILSGLYGLLRPLDLIQPYRLEMGTSWAVTPSKKNLYHYWNKDIASLLKESLGEEYLVNLASNEYFKAVEKFLPKEKIVTCHFKDFKNGEYKSLMTYAKNARGMMTKYIIRNKINNVEDLKAFDMKGYTYNDRLSSELDLIFTRDKLPQ